MLIPNTHRQSKVVSTPPSSGPSATATAPPTAQTPRARARRPGSGKASLIRAIDAGSMIAAAAPLPARAAINAPMVGASAQAIEVRPKRATPVAKARFAPMRSARFPANSSNDANSRV
jgi:hypothetical protein